MLAGQALRADLRLSNLGDDAVIEIEHGLIRVSHGDKRHDIALHTMPENAHGYVLMAEETYNPPTVELDEYGQVSPMRFMDLAHMRR